MLKDDFKFWLMPLMGAGVLPGKMAQSAKYLLQSIGTPQPLQIQATELHPTGGKKKSKIQPQNPTNPTNSRSPWKALLLRKSIHSLPAEQFFFSSPPSRDSQQLRFSPVNLLSELLVRYEFVAVLCAVTVVFLGS